MIWIPSQNIFTPTRNWPSSRNKQRGSVAMMAAGGNMNDDGMPVGRVTLANSGGTVGFDAGVFGSVTDQLFSGRGVGDGVVALFSSAGADFQIEIKWVVGGDPGVSGVWTELLIEDGGGTQQTFLAADSSGYFYSGGTDTAFWPYGDGSSRLWEAADIAEVKRYDFNGRNYDT